VEERGNVEGCEIGQSTTGVYFGMWHLKEVIYKGNMGREERELGKDTSGQGEPPPEPATAGKGDHGHPIRTLSKREIRKKEVAGFG